MNSGNLVRGGQRDLPQKVICLAVEGQRLETGRTETSLIAHSLVLSLGMLYSYLQQQSVYVGCGV